MSQPGKASSLVAHVDGASRGNPGPAAFAVVVETPQGEAVTHFSRYLGQVTNNVAEYNGLLGALRYAVEQGLSRLQVLTDSELMARQIEGIYKVKNPDLKPLYAEARRLIGRLNAFSIRYVPREQNREADRLCNQTLDSVKNGQPRPGNPGRHDGGEARKHGEAPSPVNQPERPGVSSLTDPEKPLSPRGQPMGEPAAIPLTVLSEEEQLFRAMAREFAEKEIQPHVERMDREGVFDRELLATFFEQGFMSIGIPEEYGGSGGTFFMSILAIEEFSRVDASAGVIVDVQNTLVANALLRWGNAEQKSRYLPRLAEDTVGAYALSEPGAGSDAFALATRAREEGGDYILNGRKLWITNAKEAGLFILFANVNPGAGYKGITAFLVESRTSGFAVGKKEDKLGIRASSTCELIMEDCRIPKSQVLGEVGRGYKVAIETLNEGRIGIGAQMVGLAQGALGHALTYARERKQFGRPISDFQAIQMQLARLATDVEAARLLTYNAARLKDAGRPFLKEAAMAKYFCSQVAERVASEAVEVFGGYGFTKDYPVEKYLRDAKIGKIYEGTSFMQLLTIAKAILGG
jgi:short-chain 2-methylacyl-CoA dehydrogenase